MIVKGWSCGGRCHGRYRYNLQPLAIGCPCPPCPFRSYHHHPPYTHISHLTVNSIIDNITLINTLKGQKNKHRKERCISFLSLSLSHNFALWHYFFSQVTSEWGSYLRSYKVEQDIFPGMACKSKTQLHDC